MWRKSKVFKVAPPYPINKAHVSEPSITVYWKDNSSRYFSVKFQAPALLTMCIGLGLGYPNSARSRPIRLWIRSTPV